MFLFKPEYHFKMVKDGNPVALEMFERHYSCYHYKDGRERKLFVGAGQNNILHERRQRTNGFPGS